jgi:hypothetical protein
VPYIVVRAQHHNITMGSAWIDDILRSTNIICSVVDPGNVVAVDSIVLENKCISVIMF